MQEPQRQLSEATLEELSTILDQASQLRLKLTQHQTYWHLLMVWSFIVLVGFIPFFSEKIALYIGLGSVTIGCFSITKAVNKKAHISKLDTDLLEAKKHYDQLFNLLYPEQGLENND